MSQGYDVVIMYVSIHLFSRAYYTFVTYHLSIHHDVVYVCYYVVVVLNAQF
jgi:hypothetical protein